MEKELTKEFFITTNQRDCYDNLKLSTILDYAQEVAGLHADALSIGYNDFIKNDLIWVVVRNKFDILKPTYDLKNIKIKTYPLKNQFLEYPRDYEIYDENNDLIIKGRSIWMIYSLKENKAVAPSLSIYNKDIKGVYESRVTRLTKPTKNKEDYVKDVVISFSKLDHNKHMNNTTILDYYLDLVKPIKTDNITSFQVEYASQCYEDDLMSLYKRKEGNNYLIYGYKEDILKFYFVINLKGE